MKHSPIFLRPFGRTGGTLLTTILDVHPDIAMSYEIFQDRLVRADGECFSTPEAIRAIQNAYQADDEKWAKSIPEPNLKTFVARARRAGITVEEALQELRDFHQAGGLLQTLDGRLDYIDRLMQLKMRKTGKSRWGGKANNVELSRLLQRHPHARFLAMVRDGRDVLASQLNVGNFKTNARQCAEQWRNTILGFREFIESAGGCGMFVRYESLVTEPESVLREVCDFVGVTFASQMLEYEREDLTLLKAPHGHLSHRQIAAGLNASSIGRWKSDLTTDDVQTFEQINRDLLIEFQYAA